jgi:hypothetical protein
MSNTKTFDTMKADFMKTFTKVNVMPLLNLEYITNQEGKPTAVVIPIEIWRQLLPIDKAIDEGKNTPLYSHAEALAFLED